MHVGIGNRVCRIVGDRPLDTHTAQCSVGIVVKAKRIDVVPVEIDPGRPVSVLRRNVHFGKESQRADIGSLDVGPAVRSDALPFLFLAMLRQADREVAAAQRCQTIDVILQVGKHALLVQRPA